MNGKSKSKEEENKPGLEKEVLKCGIIMPISPIDGLSAEHWKEVLSIISTVIDSAGFDPNLVSNSSDVGIIQKRIVQNIYNNPILVCDVSAKNPNVMFELGLRLAFDKPTIIIKDDATDYNFDTSPIEHLSYPRDLRFTTILDFKETLKKKIIATYRKSQEDSNFSTFLKHFGEYKISNLGEKEISSEKYLLQSIEELKEEVRFMRNHVSVSINNSSIASKAFTVPKRPDEHIRQVIENRSEVFINGLGFKNYLELNVGKRVNSLIEYLWSMPDIKPHFKDKESLYEFVNDDVYGLPF